MNPGTGDRYFQAEDDGITDALSGFINEGRIILITVGSIDNEKIRILIVMIRMNIYIWLYKRIRITLHQKDRSAIETRIHKPTPGYVAKC